MKKARQGFWGVSGGCPKRHESTTPYACQEIVLETGVQLLHTENLVLKQQRAPSAKIASFRCSARTNALTICEPSWPYAQASGPHHQLLAKQPFPPFLLRRRQNMRAR